MYEHIDKSFTLKNSQFTKGNNDFSRPFNNIILPIANVNYRTEGFDVKDVEVFVDNKDHYHKSFLTRKYHNRWALKYSIDTAIDQSVESYFDYGLSLVKNVNDKRPEIIQLQQIAFCDQTDILSGPICLKHQYGIDEIMEMDGKWDNVDMAITNSRFSNAKVKDKEAETPGKYIEIYELHGVFPDSWLGDDYMETDDQGGYSRQLHIVTFYNNIETGKRDGVHLFKGKEKESIFKAIKRDDIFGRACGRGGIEELFHPQIWTNYSEIHLQQMLESVSKTVFKSTDKKVAQNNKLRNLKHNQIITLAEGTDFNQVAITTPNKTAFDNFINKWEQTARTIGSASDPQLGLNPVSGTPLGTTEIVTSQGQGIHEYRRGKISVFWGEIYRDWVLYWLAKDMARGDEWIEELSVDELKDVAEKVATQEANKKLKESLLEGNIPTEEEKQLIKETVKSSFMKGGKDRFLRLVKDEIKSIPLDVKFNIAGKQKNQFEIVAKLNAVFRSIFANPAILQEPGMEELFNQIMENSGFSPISFSSLAKPTVASPEAVSPTSPQAPPLTLQA